MRNDTNREAIYLAPLTSTPECWRVELFHGDDHDKYAFELQRPCIHSPSGKTSHRCDPREFLVRNLLYLLGWSLRMKFPSSGPYRFLPEHIHPGYAALLLWRCTWGRKTYCRTCREKDLGMTGTSHAALR